MMLCSEQWMLPTPWTVKSTATSDAQLDTTHTMMQVETCISPPPSSFDLYELMRSDTDSDALATSLVDLSVLFPDSREPAREDRDKHANVGTAPTQRKRQRQRRAKTDKDFTTLEFIHEALKDQIGLCRYWGKRCWNLRVSKHNGESHSLCHSHRVRANDNQRRLDFRKRGIIRCPKPLNPDYEDVSVFPADIDDSAHEADACKVGGSRGRSRSRSHRFEPYATPVALRAGDQELLQELFLGA